VGLHRGSRTSDRAHRVTQSEAEEVIFNNPLLISMAEKVGARERRFLALGNTKKARGLTAIVALRKDATLIRVISAR
jgi:uncharacterized DUF497 family protein